MAGFLVAAGADVAVGGHCPILPILARGAQEADVSIFASVGIRAFFASDMPFLSSDFRDITVAVAAQSLRQGPASSHMMTGSPSSSTKKAER